MEAEGADPHLPPPRRRRTPRADKQLDYTRQRRSRSEYPHAFRRKWPRKKARAEQAFRRTQRQALEGIPHRVEEEHLDEAQDRFIAVHRQPVRNWGASPLGEVVRVGLEQRFGRTCWNLFKEKYRSEQHRSQFVAYLGALTSSRRRTYASQQLARVFATWTYPEALERDRVSPTESPPWTPAFPDEWLRAFFHDEPAWEPRLRAWIDAMLDPRDTNRA